MRRVMAVLIFIYAMLLLSACTREAKADSAAYDREGVIEYTCVSENAYLKNAPWCKTFTIYLNPDGTSTYTQPVYSSYYPIGKWSIEDGTLVIRDNSFEIVNYFDIEDGYIRYRAEESEGFMYYNFKDGEIFFKDIASVSLENENYEDYRGKMAAKDGYLETVKTDGFVVMENSDVTQGKEIWEEFYKKTETGEPCSVRIAHYYTLDESKTQSEGYLSMKDDYPALYLNELIYDGEQFLYRPIHISGDGDYLAYCIEGYESPERVWKYLMHYTGEAPSQSAKFSRYDRYVLVDDDTITWDQIWSGMLSSQYGASIQHDQVYCEYTWK